MYIQEFADLISDGGVLNETFSRGEIYPLWNVSMMTQVDEINSDRHLNMYFAEFIEAICRVADKLAIPHLILDEISLEQLTPALEKKFRARNLGIKIEALVLHLSKRCLGKTFHEFTTISTYKQYVKDGLNANEIIIVF